MWPRARCSALPLTDPLITGVSGCFGTKHEIQAIFDGKSGGQTGCLAGEHGKAQFWV